jgi:hypothetical protein
MIRAWLAVAATGGFFSVAAGAVGAPLAIVDRTAELVRTGALYGMVHAAALIGVAMVAETPHPARSRLDHCWLRVCRGPDAVQPQPFRVGADRLSMARLDHAARRSWLPGRLGGTRSARYTGAREPAHRLWLSLQGV